MLHVTNGDAAVAALRDLGVREAILAWRDVLHEGPVRAADRGAAAVERAQFLAAAGWGEADALQEDFERRDGTLLDALERGEPVALWFEDDLYDQLQLVQVLDLVAAAAPAADVRLVDLPRPPHALKGDPGALVVAGAQRAGEQQLTLAAEAWAAIRAGDPPRLARLATRGGAAASAGPVQPGAVPPAADAAALHHLPAALERLLEELPGTRDGLARSERALLHAVGGGDGAPARAFRAAAAAEERPWLGDAWAWARLDALAGGPAPLLAADDGLPPQRFAPHEHPAAYLAQRFTLTPKGEAVLAGEGDWLRDGGVDRWLGGLRLRSPGPAWRWDAEARVPRAP